MRLLDCRNLRTFDIYRHADQGSSQSLPPAPSLSLEPQLLGPSRWIPWGVGSRWARIIHGNKDHDTDLVVLSANVSGLANESHFNTAMGIDADVICVQEVGAPDSRLKALSRRAARMGRFMAWGPQKPDLDMRAQRGSGCGFVSRFPLGRCHADPDAVHNRAAFAAVPLKGGGNLMIATLYLPCRGSSDADSEADRILATNLGAAHAASRPLHHRCRPEQEGC